jgi:chromosome segregation ATPase
MIDIWRRILDVRDPSALGLACDAFVSETDHARREANAARASEAAALKRASDLEVTLAQLRAQLDQEQNTIQDLRRAATQAARDAEAAQSHARDDYERLRTRVLRRLTREVELLDEGILAIKRDPPKLHVMADHGDRALSGLREEIKALQKEDAQ